MSRITTFPLNEPENWLYSPDVISFAIEKGFYKTDSGKPFSFRDAYHPRPGARSEAGLRRASLEHLPPRGSQPAFFRRLLPRSRGGRGLPAVRQARQAARGPGRDGADARPLRGNALRHDQGRRRRPVRQPAAASRPGVLGRRQELHVGTTDLDPAGGLRGRDPEPQGPARRDRRRDLVHAGRGVHVLLHPALLLHRRPAGAYTRGDYQKFSWDSAWWVTNLVSNLAYDRWSRVFPDIQQAQREQEAALLKMQPVIEETAAKLAAIRPGPHERRS